MTGGTKDIRIGAFRVRTVTAPLPQPHKTASGTLDAAPLVLLDIETDAGVTGSSYLFPYAAFFLRPLALLVSELEELIKGQPLMPRDIWTMLKTRTRLAGYPGLMACAVGGIDMALWDALAKAHGLPLASLLGAEPRPVWVYDSLGQMGPEETARDIERSLKDGFRAFKVKSGDPDPRVDVAVARAIKSVAGDDAWTAMDFNQAFTAEEAVKRMHLLDHEGIAWIEEPVAWDDFEGHANVRAAISTPVQSGENWYGARDMAKMVEAGALDHAMPDAMRIGGVTGWMEVAGLAAAHNIPVSSHLFPDHSVHLLAATPTGYILEWFDLAAGILAERPKIVDGMVSPLDLPGAGIVWDEKAIAEYAA
ncbi:enolase C-terminal domain-like protein [Nisaea denitrificans]|uniref:enolase C-terminal domain-like protein n=1 Tax=Nisaea denitrificans TaxID=390877 RepID=UPI00040CACF0|nr:enolase C-terminal domain-like protein [Nisaea denitrificans]